MRFSQNLNLSSFCHTTPAFVPAQDEFWMDHNRHNKWPYPSCENLRPARPPVQKLQNKKNVRRRGVVLRSSYVVGLTFLFNSMAL
jgi:hypothetical protein